MNDFEWSHDTVRVVSDVDDAEVGNAVLEALELADGTQSITSADDTGSDQVAELVVGLVVTVVITTGLAGWVTDVFYRVRQRFRPMIVLDLRQETPKITVRKDVPGMRGELVIQRRSGDEVDIVDPQSSSDLLAAVLGAIKG